MKQVIDNLKKELKSLALHIRSLKNERKEAPNGYVSGLSDAQFTYRCLHILRCVLRGRTIYEIEKNRKTPVSVDLRIGMKIHKKLKELKLGYRLTPVIYELRKVEEDE